MKITNNAIGARGVNLQDGTTVWLEPGESRTFDKDDVTSVHGDLGAEAPKLAGLNKAELLEVAADEGVTEAKDKDGNAVSVAEATNAAIVEAIEAKRQG